MSVFEASTPVFTITVSFIKNVKLVDGNLVTGESEENLVWQRGSKKDEWKSRAEFLHVVVVKASAARGVAAGIRRAPLHTRLAHVPPRSKRLSESSG